MKIVQRLQHRLNALHVHCFLVKIGVNRATAKVWAARYEQFAHPLLYRQWRTHS
ncbi:MAG TPA: hypothetical protein VNM22_03715 [Candidatus Limnocylindrales bacterium]|nr:hypothetical protein [Candidatus Limnocylindrales bacterium]